MLFTASEQLSQATGHRLEHQHGIVGASTSLLIQVTRLRSYVLRRFRKPKAIDTSPVPNNSMLVGSGVDVPESAAKPVGFPFVGAMWIAKCAPLSLASNNWLAEENPPVLVTVKLKLVMAPDGLQQLSVTSKFPKPSMFPPPRLAVRKLGE